MGIKDFHFDLDGLSKHSSELARAHSTTRRKQQAHLRREAIPFVISYVWEGAKQQA